MTIEAQLALLTQRIERIELRLSEPLPEWPPNPRDRWRIVLRLVAGRYGFSEYDLTCHKRPEHMVWARQVAMFLCHELLEMNHTEIARLFERHRSDVPHSLQSVVTQCGYDRKRREEVAQLRHALDQYFNQTHNHEKTN